MPSLSELQAWDTTHLQNAARDWTATAQLWEASFSSIHQAVLTPGGTVWEGAAAEAAQQSTLADLVQVRGWADVLHESAAIARRGAETVSSAKNSALSAVEEAQAAGYRVGEDLSVSPSRPDPVSAAQAQVYAAGIQHRVAQLVVHDNAIAAQIAATTAPLDTVTFAGTPNTSPHKPEIQAVDDQTQTPGPPPGLSADEIRRVLEKLPQGSKSSIREVRSQQDLDKLWNWMKQNGVVRPGGYPNTPGEIVELPDGTTVGRRDASGSTKQPALDVRVPGANGYTKVHINPQSGGEPEIPAAPAPVEPPPEHQAEPPSRPAESGPAEPPAERAPVEPPPAPAPTGGGFGGGGGGPLSVPGHAGPATEPME